MPSAIVQLLFSQLLKVRGHLDVNNNRVPQSLSMNEIAKILGGNLWSKFTDSPSTWTELCSYRMQDIHCCPVYFCDGPRTCRAWNSQLLQINDRSGSLPSWFWLSDGQMLSSPKLLFPGTSYATGLWVSSSEECPTHFPLNYLPCFKLICDSSLYILKMSPYADTLIVFF